MRHHASCRRVSSTVWLSVVLLLQISRAHGIDVSGCGRTKGCFRDPEDCDAESCEFFLAWHDNGTDSVLFEMSAPVDSRNAWVAFGLSKNAKMGSDSVIACVYVEAAGRVKIEESWNTDSRTNQLLSNQPVGVLPGGQSSVNDSRLWCSFSRKKQVSDPQVYPIDADNTYHILMAKGEASSSGSKLQHAKRIASTEDINFTAVAVVGGGDTGETKRLLTKVHGIMMVAAWCVFASFGMLMPRYYKPTWSGKTCCGKAIWFQTHQPFMIFTLFTTTAAFIIIFVAVEGYSQLPSPGVAHPPLGICVMALVLINPLMAMCRPTPDASRRWIFNLFHFTVGFLAQLGSATAVFLGIWQFGLPDWCMIVMAALVAFHMIVELILIIHYNAGVLCKCCIRKKYSLGEDIPMDRFDIQRKEEASRTSHASDIFKTMMIFVHLFGVVAFSVVLAVKIYQHDGPQRGPDIISMLE